MGYYVARLSFYKPAQRVLIKSDIECEEKPINLTSKLLQEGIKEFSAPRNLRGGIKRGYVDFVLDNFIIDESKNLLGFKLGVEKTAKLPKHGADGFYKAEDTIYPNLVVLWDSENQLLLIQKVSYVKIEQLIKSLEYYLQDLVKTYELTLNLALFTDEHAFWDTVKDNEKLYSVRFVLFSPNLIFAKSAEKYLTHIKNNYQASETVLELKSETGNLKFSKTDKSITSILSWIKPGGGYWETKIGPRTIIKSEIGKKVVNIELTNFNLKEIKKTLKMVEELLEDELKGNN